MDSESVYWVIVYWRVCSRVNWIVHEWNVMIVEYGVDSKWIETRVLSKESVKWWIEWCVWEWIEWDGMIEWNREWTRMAREMSERESSDNGSDNEVW